MNSSNRSSAAFRKIFSRFLFHLLFVHRLAEPVDIYIYTELRLKTVSREGSAPWGFRVLDPRHFTGDERKRNRRRSSRPSSFFSHGTSSNRICLNSFHLCPCLFIIFFSLSLSLSLTHTHTLSPSFSLLSFIFSFFFNEKTHTSLSLS